MSSFDISLSDDDFRRQIESLYEKLTGKTFALYTLDNNRRLQEAPMKVTYFKDRNYKGTTVIKILDNSVSSDRLSQSQPVTSRNPETSNQTAVSSENYTTSTVQGTSNQSTVSQSVPPLEPQHHQSLVATPLSSPGGRSIRVDEEISFNPRIRLRLQQDLEFAESLARDQDRETQVQQARLRRDMARLERRRMRQVQREEKEKKNAAVIEEMTQLKTIAAQDDLFSVAFVLPTGEQRRIIPKTCSSEKLHQYVEAIGMVELPKLIYCGKVISRDDHLLKDHGIDSNCRVIVEDTLQQEASESEDEELEQDIREENPLQIKDLQAFEERRVTVLTNLLPTIQLQIRWSHILQDVLDAYTLNPNIVHHRLEVIFEGEMALDLEGVTREMFSTVLQQALTKYFIGNEHKVPGTDHRYLFTGVYETIGRIICYSIVLVDYLPPDLSPVMFSVVGCGYCSNEMVLSFFLSYIREDERKMLLEAMNSNQFSKEAELKLMNFLGDYDGRTKILPGNAKKVILEIARSHLIAKPLYAVSSITKGLNCYPLLWQGLSEEMARTMFDKTKPNAQKVIDRVDYEFAEDMVLRSLEERVKGYFERYVSGLTFSSLSRLLRFWTSANTLCVRTLNVAFNSNDGLQKRPVANTCSSTLQISRMYLSYQELSDNFDLYLSDDRSFVFDTI